jgi:hypothetical protein
LTQDYFLRLIGDHAFSHGVLGYLRAGMKTRRASLSQYVRLAFQGVRRGRFPMKCQWVALRGGDRASRFITEHRLEPVQFAAQGRGLK